MPSSPRTRKPYESRALRSAFKFQKSGRGNPLGGFMTFRYVTGLLCAAAMSVAFAAGARAEDKTVKIGVIMPMSGGTASIGAHAKAAIEVALDIINNAHPELAKLPLAK